MIEKNSKVHLHLLHREPEKPEPIRADSCSLCRYAAIQDDGKSYLCHRNPPQMLAVPGQDYTGRMMIKLQGVFPAVDKTCWCGMFHVKQGEN